jgi:hypothetical protein
MKVYEIISMNEAVPGLGFLGKGAELLGKGLEKVKNPIKAFRGAEGALKDAIAKEIGDIARVQNIDIKDAAKMYSARLEHKIENEMMNIQRRERALGRPMPDINSPQLRAKAMENLEIDARQLDKNFVKDASTSAQLTRGAEALGLKDASWWRGLWMTGSGALKVLGFYQGFVEPWNEFNRQMQIHAQEVASNKISEEQYNGYMNQEVTILVSKWASQMVLTGIFKMVVLNKESNTRGIGNWIKEKTGADMTSAAGVYWFRSWVNDSDAQKWLASALLMDIGSSSQPFAQAIGKILAPILSLPHRFTGGRIGPPVDGAEAKTGKIAGGATASDGSGGKPVASNPSASGANKQIDATSPAAPADGATQSTGTLGKSYFNFDSDMTNWEVDPQNPQYIRNPADHSDFVIKPPGWKPAAK